MALFARVLGSSGSPLGLRALDRARSQLGVKEATGNNDGPEIAKYFAGATRIINGQEKPTGWAAGWEWCAAFASWCAFEARQGAETVPHGWRIAVWELVRDARASGAWRDWTLGASSGPRPGDLVIYRRKGDPRQPGQTGQHEDGKISGMQILSARSGTRRGGATLRHSTWGRGCPCTSRCTWTLLGPAAAWALACPSQPAHSCPQTPPDNSVYSFQASHPTHQA